MLIWGEAADMYKWCYQTIKYYKMHLTITTMFALHASSGSIWTLISQLKVKCQTNETYRKLNDGNLGFIWKREVKNNYELYNNQSDFRLLSLVNSDMIFDWLLRVSSSVLFTLPYWTHTLELCNVMHAALVPNNRFMDSYWPTD